MWCKVPAWAVALDSRQSKQAVSLDKTAMICGLALVAAESSSARYLCWQEHRLVYLIFLKRSRVPKDNRVVRVGDMLVAARIVSSAEITEAIQVSKRLSVPIGRVLITSGCVTEKLLHSALDLQSLIRDGEVPLESALKALTRIDKTGCSVKESLEHLNFRPKYSKGKNNLADLLVDSNLVSQEQIDEALTTSFEHGTPLGSTLVFQGALSPNFFPSISAIQEKMTNGELSNEEAIDELKEAFALWLKAGDRTKQPALKTIDELSEPIPATHRKRHTEPKALSNPRAQERHEQEVAKTEPKEEPKEKEPPIEAVHHPVSEMTAEKQAETAPSEEAVNQTTETQVNESEEKGETHDLQKRHHVAPESPAEKTPAQ